MKKIVIFSRFFDLNFFRRSISKFSNYSYNKPFRPKFCAKLCGIQRRRPRNQNPRRATCVGCLCKKNQRRCKKISTFRYLCPPTGSAYSELTISYRNCPETWKCQVLPRKVRFPKRRSVDKRYEKRSFFCRAVLFFAEASHARHSPCF